MKKFTFLLILFLLPSTFAIGGTGLKYGFEFKELTEKSEHCLTYGVYNPFDEDSNIILSAEGDYSEYQLENKPTFVPANTGSSNTINKDICFKFPKIVESCEEGKLLSGQILASTVSTENSGIGTALAVSAPLDIKLICNENNNVNFIYFTIPGILILGLISLVHIRKNSRTKKYNKLYSELIYLQKIISSGNFNQSHVDRFNKIRSILINFK